MNGIPNNESEIRQRDLAIMDALTGLNVSVVMGTLVGDSVVRPLDKDGAQAVLDRLRARGFKVERA